MPEFVYVEDAEVVIATKHAIKVELHNGEMKWIPKAQLHPDCTLEDQGDTGDLILPRWVAEENDIECDGEYEQ